MTYFDLSGRTVVVTGGNGGIGLGIAEALADAGADIAIWARNEEKNAAAVESVRALGRRCEAFVCDVADPAQVDAAMADTLDAFGTIDSMFANAGTYGGAPFLEQTLEGWRRVTSVNLDGVFLTLQAAARHLVERGEGGSLVAVASTSAIDGAPANQAYSAAKAGVVAIMKGLAIEFARHNIRANTLLPGWTETDMTAPLQGWEKFMNNTISRTPARRWGTPADMGPAAVFLADPTHTFHTGDCLVVDGGYTIF
ncbi:MAG: SDR family oxidoreductase [Actinobacteria bacterium]|nr:SDR family oxidoreductase [Actinomycetota bacterium]